MRPVFRVIVAGGRDFRNYDLLKKKLDYYLSRVRATHDIRIVSGLARGADRLGLVYAKENHLPVDQFPAKWNEHGKRAGYLRNAEMANNADALVAFWDGQSKGTKHMIDIAKKKKLKVRVVHYA